MGKERKQENGIEEMGKKEMGRKRKEKIRKQRMAQVLWIYNQK